MQWIIKTKKIRINHKQNSKMYMSRFTLLMTRSLRSNRTFPATTSRGNKYIMVLVEIDENYIDAEPMKNKTEGSMIKAYLVYGNAKQQQEW